MFTRTTVRLLFLVFAVGLWLIATQPVYAAPLDQAGEVYLPLIVGSTAQNPTPTPTPLPDAPSDQELIASGLQQGKIDYGTSLLYRFYSLFADDRLPASYRGAGSMGEDPTLFAEASAPTLPADIRTKLRPFLLRPDQAESAHTLKAKNGVQLASDPASALACNDVWAARSSAKPGIKVRVHALCMNDYAGDIQYALTLIESLWTPMTTLMGAPIPDTGGTDGGSTDEIDFYLLDPLGAVWRDGVNRAIRADALAVAPAAEPFANNRSSGYVLMARRDLRDPSFKSTLAHEFFHILQNAHNESISFHGPTEWWFVEASAVWAEWNFVPETSDMQVHPRFSATYRNEDQSLHRSYDISSAEGLKSGSSAYAGYIWPFFVQQEQNASSIGNIWKELEGVGDNWDKAMKVIDEQLPFALHFHRFAFRNLNSPFEGDNPLGTRYVNLDPRFPDDWLPVANIEQTLAPMPPQSSQLFTDSIPSLRAHYYHFTLEDTVRQVTFDLTGLQPLLDRKVGAMVKIKGKPWQMREIVSDLLTFCRSNADEDLEEIWFVASNDQIEITKTVSGPIKVQASSEDCGCDIDTWAKFQSVTAWQGHVTYQYRQSAARGDRSASIVELGDLSSTLSRTPEQPFWGKVISGTTQVEYRESCCKGYVQTISGSGIPVPFGAGPDNDAGYSRMLLSFREYDCTYNFHTNTFVNGVFTSGDSSTEGIYDTGAVGGLFHKLPHDGLTLSGSASFPVHTEEFILTFDSDFFSATHDHELLNLLGEDNLGRALVTWSFEPVDPPQAAEAPSK